MESFGNVITKIMNTIRISENVLCVDGPEEIFLLKDFIANAFMKIIYFKCTTKKRLYMSFFIHDNTYYANFLISKINSNIAICEF